VQNMVQHSYSNHVDHIRRQTHGYTHTHTHAWHLSPFELARTRTRTHAHIHTLSNHECTCMPDRKLKNHNISFRDSRMHSSGRPVCIHTTHKNPELQRMCRSCLIESTCTHTHILAGSETCTHTHTHTQIHTRALISRSYTAQAGPSEYTHTHTYIHTCTQHFAFDAENTHRRLFLTFK
jgi:hypothetical protein